MGMFSAYDYASLKYGIVFAVFLYVVTALKGADKKMSVFWRILIYIKRLCKMPAFVIALLLMPVIAYGIKNFTTLENKG